ncbi:MAG: acetate--CoA ligase family protein [Geminicoccaceae bacterium]
MGRSETTLDDLLTPRSIAIVGASNDPTRIGGRPLSHMINQRFEGAVYPVNPKRDTVQGLKAYPSLSDVPGEIDFILIAVPAASVLDVMRAVPAKQPKTVLIFTSGFAETGPVGAALQDEILTIANDHKIRLVGPNCLGLFNAAHRFFPTFTSTIDRATPVPGGVSIASQSGAYGSHIYFVSHLRGLGIRYWLTTGNEADLHIAEAIQLLAESDDVHTIMAYAESIKDGPLLIEALETARANRKPVIFMKVGRSLTGAAAATSHTASLAGEDAIYDTVLREHGAWRVRSTEEMLDVAYGARPRIFPAGRKLGLVTISGGAGILMADDAEALGLDVSPMPEDAQAALQETIPYAAPRNPVDVTAQFFNDLSIVPHFIELMLERGGYDGLIGFWTSVAGSPVLAEPLLKGLKQAMAGRRDKLFLQSVVAPSDIRAKYEAIGFPCFEDPSRAVLAMAALMNFGEAFAAVAPVRPSTLTFNALPAGALSEYQATKTLAAAGLPMIDVELARTAMEAEALASGIGGSVVLKVVSPDILHKTEARGVLLDVAKTDAAAGFEQIIKNALTHQPGARIDGILVGPMIESGVDCLLGTKVDPVFGPMVLFGLGGIFTEVLDDVIMRSAPIDPKTAGAMIDELKGAAILSGARGHPPVDLEALASVISRFSCWAAAMADVIESAEINPLRVLPDRCIGLDAVVIKRTI